MPDFRCPWNSKAEGGGGGEEEEKEEVEEEEKEEVEEFGRTGGLHVREQEIADESSKELGTTA